MRREFVFGDLRPFSQCHAATLAQRRDGGLFACWFGGTREGHRDVAIWGAGRAADWRAPRVLARVCDAPHWNPVVFPVGPDDFVLHFKVGRSIASWSTWHQRSRDGGRTWSEATELVPGDRGGRGAVRTPPVRLDDGRFVAGASLERSTRWDAFFELSPDGLGDWHATPPVPFSRRGFRGKGLIQPTIWASTAHDVHALFRTTTGLVYRADSADGGRHWGEARPTLLPNNNSGLDAVRLPSGALALACNPVAGNWAARTPLSVLFSFDGGAQWPARLDVESGPGEFSYPTLLLDGEGLVLAYTWNRRRIAVAWIGPEEIPAA